MTMDTLSSFHPFSELFDNIEKNTRVLKSPKSGPLLYNSDRNMCKGAISMNELQTPDCCGSGHPLSGKWKLDILYRLTGGSLRWSALVHSLPDAAPNVLTRQLRQLEEEGMVLRVITSSQPPQVIEYALSDAGQRLIPVLLALGEWDRKYRPSLAG